VHRVLDPIVRVWFRSEVRQLGRVPSEQTLVVTHHDGGVLPVNGLCFGLGWHEHFDFQRPLFVLTHDVLHQALPPLGSALRAVGCIRADRHQMDAALSTGASVLVFPGAARESFRPFWHRRRIDLGGRTGFVAQAIRWDLPITPVVTAGSHETLIVLSRGHQTAKRLGVQRLVRSADVWPVLAGLPWGLWALPFLPHVPLPAKLTTEVLEPIYLPKVLGRRLSPRDAEDPDVVQAGFHEVLRRMRAGLDRLYDARRWPIFG